MPPDRGHCRVVTRRDHSYAVAIVTDGSSATGREIALSLAGEGCAVVVVYLSDQAEAEGVVEAILDEHGPALAVRADTEDELDVERLFDEAAAAFGAVDIVVQPGARSAVVDREAARRLRDAGADRGLDRGLHGREERVAPRGSRSS